MAFAGARAMHDAGLTDPGLKLQRKAALRVSSGGLRVKIELLIELLDVRLGGKRQRRLVLPHGHIP